MTPKTKLGAQFKSNTKKNQDTGASHLNALKANYECHEKKESPSFMRKRFAARSVSLCCAGVFALSLSRRLLRLVICRATLIPIAFTARKQSNPLAMKTNNVFARLRQALLIISILKCPSLSLLAAGTAFTYQGRLSDSSNPANGNYDFRFRLALDPQGNNYAGSPVLTNGVLVSGGLFTVSLDFGSVFTGSNYWLEVDVRTNGAAVYSSLTPLEALSPVPYALYALTPAGPAGPPGPQGSVGPAAHKVPSDQPVLLAHKGLSGRREHRVRPVHKDQQEDRLLVWTEPTHTM